MRRVRAALAVAMIGLLSGMAWAGTLRITKPTVDDSRVTVPVLVEGDVGDGVAAMDFVLNFDPRRTASGERGSGIGGERRRQNGPGEPHQPRPIQGRHARHEPERHPFGRGGQSGAAHDRHAGIRPVRTQHHQDHLCLPRGRRDPVPRSTLLHRFPWEREWEWRRGRRRERRGNSCRGRRGSRLSRNA